MFLAQSLIDGIGSGKYPVGSLLPPENDLALQYSISRHTVREALRRLQGLGLISRQAGIGTRVEAQAPRKSYIQEEVGVTDLRGYVADLKLTITSHQLVTVHEELAAYLPAQVGQRWLEGQGMRHLPGQEAPIAISRVYIAPPYVDIAPMLTDLTKPIYVLIEERFDVAVLEISQSIDAIKLSPQQADQLVCDVDEPALKIERRYFVNTGELVEVAVNIHPASRFSFRSNLRTG